MKEIKSSTGSVKGQYGAAVLKKLSGFAVSVLVLMWFSGAVHADTEWPRVALSKDGTPISYEIQGSGQTTLVFIHGWSCDARYWRMQQPVFSNKYRVVTLDLAGHGHSGLSRSRYTMRAFGEDVQVVVEATESEQVILIGHSMGGAVIAEAARLMPKRVRGLIGVDTLGNVEYPMTAEEYEQMAAPLKADFKNGSRQFVKPMILPGTDPTLAEWILSDMASAPSAVALSAMEEMMSQYISGEAARIFEDIPVPVISVNADLWPIDYEANRRHMTSYEAIILKGADHFLMMNRPLEFNWALEQAIQTLLAREVTIHKPVTAGELSND
ncbi:MAG: alpha/beta hydrolase [Candidatus Thiodiazotropha sp. (ex Lucinoma borealis)]|nr:alpha/beta hydrolase [Candidatus Thiodiazotropha sp. (ex Lucinoma borealis)]